MGYGFIVMIVSTALAGVNVFATDASFWLKVLVVALLLFSFAWRYGSLLQAALGMALCLYFTYLKSR